MESCRRTITKAICWQGLGIFVMTGLGFFFTGSVTQGGKLALVSAAISTVTYFLHERLWDRIGWGRQS